MNRRTLYLVAVLSIVLVLIAVIGMNIHLPIPAEEFITDDGFYSGAEIMVVAETGEVATYMFGIDPSQRFRVVISTNKHKYLLLDEGPIPQGPTCFHLRWRPGIDSATITAIDMINCSTEPVPYMLD